MSEIDWSGAISGAVGFLFGVVVKTLLDLRLGIWMVKYFSWIRPRWIFGENPYSLKGTWEHIWGPGGSEDFSNEIDRHGHSQIQQLGPYFYAEFISKKKSYYFFGRILGQYIVGEWFDQKNRQGYYGSFELRVVNADLLEGKWLGHSQKTMEIRVDNTRWNRVPQ